MKNVKTIPAIAAIISLSLTNGTWGQTQTSHNPHFNAETYEIFLPDSFLNTVYDDAFFGGGSSYYYSGSGFGIANNEGPERDDNDNRQRCLLDSYNSFYECADDAAVRGYLKEIGALAAGFITGLFFKSKSAGAFVTTSISGAVLLEYKRELLACNGERLQRDLGCENIEPSYF